MDVCANVLYIRLLLLLPHNCHDTTTTRWWPSFSFFSFPFRCSRGSVIYPPTTVVNGPDSRGQCAWKLANREEKRGGLLYLVLWARCSSVVYNIPILLILYTYCIYQYFGTEGNSQQGKWDVQCRGNQLRTKRSRLFYSRSVFFLFFFPVDY